MSKKTNEKDTSTEKVRKVFQGGPMREDASFFDKFTYRYAWPLLESSMTQQICFEQYGDLPDRMKGCHTQKKIKDNIQYYFDKDPNDKLAFAKGLFMANWKQLLTHWSVRMVLMVDDIANPFLLASFIGWL